MEIQVWNQSFQICLHDSNSEAFRHALSGRTIFAPDERHYAGDKENRLVNTPSIAAFSGRVGVGVGTSLRVCRRRLSLS